MIKKPKKKARKLLQLLKIMNQKKLLGIWTVMVNYDGVSSKIGELTVTVKQ